MNILNHEINAVIFDMDGTLIDSTGLWHEIDMLFFAKRGMELPKDYAQKIVHLGLRKAAELTRELYGVKQTPDEIIQEWRQMALDMYHNDVELKPGAIALLETLKSNGLKLAIATANDAELYMPCIMRLGIGDYFDFIADVNSSKEGKNSAKIYLDLTEKMNSKPENTLVLEDMPTCVKTAFKNGFITVAVYDNASKRYDQEKKDNSHLFINDFSELLELLK
jgi:HAD superfamily hydrolase (TIGR01509 family)